MTLKVLTEPCDACPFKAKIELSPGRLKDIVQGTYRDDTQFHCHKTLVGPDGEYPHYDLNRNAICAGWLEAVGGLEECPGQLIRIMGRLGGLEFVQPEVSA